MNSLHHFSTAGARLNPYEQAIKAVGEIIQEYDQTKKFPVWVMALYDIVDDKQC